jgi:hypothetical protein
LTSEAAALSPELTLTPDWPPLQGDYI